MYTPIELDKTRNLRYGMLAISKIEKKFKKTISKIDFEDLSMEDTATIIWAGLVHEDSKLTPEKVMQLVDDHSNIKDVVETMGKAFQDSMGGGIEEEKN
ncbi:hypothetical protein [Bacillus sp. JJ1474]|uniref:hypothetical protein n=1 Tax=Bacillus sp. JJ1474 TaxID=3122955 RepID=UPI002FFEE6E2